MVDISIIIVSYNTEAYLHDCLESLQNTISGGISHEVIVVDNASSDGSVAMIKKQFPQVRLLASESNDGFAKANNKGIKVAKGKYVLFLNPDTIVYKGVIDGMLQFMEKHTAAGAATCKLVMEDGKIDYAIHRGFPTPWNAFCYFSGLGKIFNRSRLFAGYTLGWMDMGTTHEVDVVAGAFLFVRREAGEEIGWWDEDYFFNGEDIEFCYRLKEKGWKIYYVPEFHILHYNGVSGGTKKHSQKITTANIASKRRIQKARFEAMKIFYRKHYTEKYPQFITKMVFAAIDAKYWIVSKRLQ